MIFGNLSEKVVILSKNIVMGIISKWEEKFGIWIFIDEQEYFLPYDKFPWFADATVKQIFNVRRLSDIHFYWEDLDVDLSIDIIKNPEKYPLIAKN